MKSNRGEFEWIVKPDPDNDNGLVPMKAIDMKKQLSIHKQMFYLFFILSMVRRVLLRIAQTMLKWIRNERKKCTIRNAKIHLLFNAAWGLIWVGTKGYLWEKYHIKQSTFKSKQSNNFFMGAKKWHEQRHKQEHCRKKTSREKEIKEKNHEKTNNKLESVNEKSWMKLLDFNIDEIETDR